MKASGTDPDYWVVPHKDKEGQWWVNNTKIYMYVLPEEEKQAYLKKMLGNNYENK